MSLLLRIRNSSLFKDNIKGKHFYTQLIFSHIVHNLYSGNYKNQDSSGIFDLGL